MSSQIEKIQNEIDNSASLELEKLKAETDEKLKIIHDATEKEISKIQQSIVDSARSKNENAAKRELGQARLQAKMSYLAEKENGITAIFEEGKKQIASVVQSSDYATILSNLIVSAGVNLGGGELVVSVPKNDTSKVNTSDIAQKISSKSGTQTTVKLDSVEPKTKLGGAIIKKSDIWVDNTFEAIIERRTESIRAELAKILFE